MRWKHFPQSRHSLKRILYTRKHSFQLHRYWVFIIAVIITVVFGWNEKWLAKKHSKKDRHNRRMRKQKKKKSKKGICSPSTYFSAKSRFLSVCLLCFPFCVLLFSWMRKIVFFLLFSYDSASNECTYSWCLPPPPPPLNKLM